jgi:hypothetical protein
MGQGFVGGELLIFDNVTWSIDLGYRYLVVNNYKSNRDSQTTRGMIYKGNSLNNTDGTARSTDLGGYMAGTSLRIYIR